MTQSTTFSPWLVRLLQTVCLVIGVIALLLIVLALHQQVALKAMRQNTPALGQRIEVTGHSTMHLHCQGSGSPSVVIDAGNGCFSLEWMPLVEALSPVARMCVYDRPGYGWSERGQQPRDGTQAVAELHSLLQQAGEKAPYLLVGHSLGGVHARLFYATYPEETAGLVLVDTAYPLEITPEFRQQIGASVGFYQVMGLLARTGILRVLGPLGGKNAMPETARKLPLKYQETYLNLLLDPLQYDTAAAEMLALPQTFEQTQQKLSSLKPGDDQPMLGSLPLIVLTAGQKAAPGSTPFDNRLVPVEADQITRQAELAASSSRGEQRLVAHSGHQMHLDAPADVVRAILDAIEMAKVAE